MVAAGFIARIGQDRLPSQPEITMRPETNQLQDVFRWFAIDQDQIGLDVTIAMVAPVTGERVVAVLG